ncbi:DMT family transporter [Bacillus tianshenii]|nr:DMT family transporter [Bacillus tianshenii]
MKKTILADVCLLLVAVVWGATFVIVQNAVAILEPFTFNAVRFGIAALFLFLWTWLFARKQFKQLNRKLVSAGLIMGTWLCAAYALQTFGLLYTSSSKAGFITGLSVVLVPLFAYLFLKQTPKPNAITGALLATFGLYLLTLGDTFSVNQGDLLVFFCAISFAMHIIVTGKYTSAYPTLLLTSVQIAVVSIWSAVGALFVEPWQMAFDLEVIAHTDVLFALIITSIFATALAFLAQTNFQKYTTPARVALIFAMEPVFAAITAFIWAGERLTSKALVGCLLIFLGMILAELPQNVFATTRRKKNSLYR